MEKWAPKAEIITNTKTNPLPNLHMTRNKVPILVVDSKTEKLIQVQAELTIPR